MRTQVARICEQCGQEFFVEPWQARRGAKFCSKKCCGQAQRNRVRHICKTCGREFLIKASAAKRGRGQFCSRKCYEIWWSENICKRGPESSFWQGGPVTRTCKNCGNRFQTWRSGGSLCSEECRIQWQRKHPKTGADNPSWKGGKVKRVCKECGIEFEVWPYETEQEFCSPSCANTNEEVRQKKAAHQWGLDNSNWKGGISFYPYPLEFNEQFKENIRERDNYTCAICYLYGNQVHHINYIKDDTIPENCITLCASCHGVTGGNREYWQSALSQLMMARQLGGKHYVTTS